MSEIDVFKALGNSTRLRILDSIKNKPRCICEIIPLTGKSQPNVSHHIKILKNAGLISEHRDKTNILIELSNKNIFEIIKIVRRMK
ncbi:MAG: ArsR family transcriptional regulator [Thermoplasmata archaeon]|nr:MAG: ArsR family transcriptional regulator [Thermoplasmata archaeon]